MAPRQWRSTILVPVPEVEELVDPIRQLHDPIAQLGVPAHVTISVPFLPPEQIDAAVLERLRRVIGQRPTFWVSFARLGRFPETLYLAPSPSAPFTALTRDLLAAFPDVQPYDGKFDTDIPHLTVADFVDARIVDRVERELAPALPLHAKIKVAWLMELRDGRWMRREELALGRE